MRDPDIRRALHAKVLPAPCSSHDTLVVDEFALFQGDTRVDVAVVNGALHGFEIKSEHDTLARLPAQALAFGRVLDRATLVVAERHLAASQAIVPDWWGIKLVAKGPRGAVRFCDLRAADANPNVEPFAVAQLLWRDEALAELEALGVARGLRHARRPLLHARLVACLTLDALRARVRDTLKRRTGWPSAESRT